MTGFEEFQYRLNEDLLRQYELPRSATHQDLHFKMLKRHLAETEAELHRLLLAALCGSMGPGKVSDMLDRLGRTAHDDDVTLLQDRVGRGVAPDDAFAAQ